MSLRFGLGYYPMEQQITSQITAFKSLVFFGILHDEID
jgi:hypothetical protein